MGIKEINDWTGERLETYVLNETMIEHLHRYSVVIPLVENRRVLDIACGEGYGTNLMAKHASYIYAVDIDGEIIKEARKKYRKENVTFIEGKADKIPLENDSVDCVVSFETIEHHDKHEEMLLEIKRVLTPGGLLIMSSPEKKTEKSFNPFHIKELTVDEFKTLINKHFIYSSFYNQKIMMGSIIVPEKVGTGFETHSGDFQHLRFSSGLEDSVFNLCIASDVEQAHFSASFFDGKEVLTNQITLPYRNSKGYKFLNFLKGLVK